MDFSVQVSNFILQPTAFFSIEKNHYLFPFCFLFVPAARRGCFRHLSVRRLPAGVVANIGNSADGTFVPAAVAMIHATYGVGYHWCGRLRPVIDLMRAKI